MPTTYGENAEITGSLAVDGNADLGNGDDDITLDRTSVFVDASENKVGIGTITPDHTLDVQGELRVSQKYIYGYEEVTAGTSQTISLNTPITFVNNMAGNLTGSVADGSTIGETKWIIVNGYNNSNDLKITFAKAAWAMGNAGHVTLDGGVLQVVWGSVNGANMWYPMTFASGSFQQGS